MSTVLHYRHRIAEQWHVPVSYGPGSAAKMFVEDYEQIVRLHYGKLRRKRRSKDRAL